MKFPQPASDAGLDVWLLPLLSIENIHVSKCCTVWPKVTKCVRYLSRDLAVLSEQIIQKVMEFFILYFPISLTKGSKGIVGERDEL